MAKPDIDELSEKLERMKIENEIEQENLSKAEKRALIRELKKRFGPEWRKALGNIRDNESLKQFANTRFRLV